MLPIFSIFLNILLPVFALVLTGYVAGPRLGIEARSLSRLAYFILVPAFIFDVFSDSQIQVEMIARMTAYSLAVACGTVLLTLLVARAMGRSGLLLAAYALVAAFGNVGNFGIPVIQFRFGEEAMVSASFYFLVLSTFGFAVGVMAATWHKGGRLGALWSALKTPGIIAVAPAVLVNWLDLPVPLFAGRAIGLLATALIPIMLLTLGVQLSGIRRPRVDRDVILASTLRLVIGPVLALALAAPFGLTGVERGAGVLQASMPAAVLAALVAIEHDLLPDFVTTAVLVSTVASALTLTVVLSLV